MSHSFVKDRPTAEYLQATLNTAVNYTAVVWTPLQFDTPSINTAGMTYSDGVWTATKPGRYLIRLFYFRLGSSSLAWTAIWRSGVRLDGGQLRQSRIDFGLELVYCLQMAVGDVFEIDTYLHVTLSNLQGTLKIVRIP